MCLSGQFVKLSFGNAAVRDPPKSPIINADITKAAHRPMNVVDARTNMIKLL